jgi:hypothetical protein
MEIGAAWGMCRSATEAVEMSRSKIYATMEDLSRLEVVTELAKGTTRRRRNGQQRTI